ncbi:MAG: hypothetical protein A2284_05180 [Deltaproteobacteria bacterium RIFOXYA12_FULL_61_11]|nr:MAG: hypothetical protein A2284_05180 [Deltaproteobacteria bacterium RIFOXYA12_FULL_61_11]
MQQQRFFIQRYRDFIIEHAGLVLLLGLVLGGLCFLEVRELRIKSNLASLLPENQPSVQNLNRVLEKVGGFGELITLIETKDFEAAERFASDLRQRVLARDYVRFADFRVDEKVFRDNALLFMDKADLQTITNRLDDRLTYEKAKINPLFVSLDEEEEPPSLDFSDLEKKYSRDKKTSTDGRYRYFANASRNLLLLVIYPSGVTSDIAFARQIYKDLQSDIETLNPKAYAPDLTINISGNFKNRIDEYESIVYNVKSSAWWSLSAIFLLISLYFLNIFAFFLIMIPLAISIMITFALTRLVLGDLNLITAFLFVILFGLGIDFGIHILARYLEERRRGVLLRVALTNIFRHTTRSLWTSTATTAVAFLMLLVTDFKGFSHFGFIAGTGVLFAFLTMMSFFPALIVLCDRFKLFGIKRTHVTSRKFTPRRYPFALPVLVVCLIGAFGGIYGLIEVDFEYDFAKLRSVLPGSQENRNKVRSVFKQSRDPAILLVDDDSELPLIAATLEAKMREDTSTPTVSGYESYLDVIPADQEEKLALCAAIKAQLVEFEAAGLSEADQASVDTYRSKLEVRKIGFDDLPEAVRRRFRGDQLQSGTLFYIYSSIPLNHGLNAIRFSEDVSEVRTSTGKVYYPSSEALIFADLVRILTHDSAIAIILVLSAVFLLILLDFRRLGPTFLVLSPLICGILWMFGLMACFDIKLNIYNMVVLPSLIGMGIDHGVHVYRRYLEEKEGSLPFILLKTGMATAMCSLTTMLGFSGMIPGNHQGLRTIGVLAVLGLALVMLATMTVLPAAMQMLEDRRTRSSTNRVAART